MNNRKTAIEGENAACEYLEKQGYEIIGRNYSCPVGEIDVIAKDKGVVVFVEVKSRNGTDFGVPEESVDIRKRKKIILTARYWAGAHGRECAKGFRFDVISVLRGKVRHIVNAFDASGKAW